MTQKEFLAEFLEKGTVDCSKHPRRAWTWMCGQGDESDDLPCLVRSVDGPVFALTELGEEVARAGQ